MFIVNAVTKPFLAGSTPETCWSKLKISADVILNAQLKIVQIFYTVNSCEYFILHIDWTRPCLSPLVKRDLVNSIPGLIYATACFMRGGTPPPLHTELLHVFSPQKGSTRFFWQKISFRHAWLMLSCCNIIWYKAFWYFEPKSICIDNDDDNDGIGYGDGDGGGDDDGDGDDVGEQMIGNWRGGVKGLLRGGSRGIGWWDHQHFLLIMIIIIMSSWSYHHHMIIIIWTWSYHHHINVVIIWSSIWPLGVAAQLLWGCGILIVSSSFL